MTPPDVPPATAEDLAGMVESFDYLDPTRPVTRGQKAAIGLLFCELTGVAYPENSLAATALLVRLRAAKAKHGTIEIPEMPF